MKTKLEMTDYKNFCPICNMPDDDKNLCRCDYVSPGKMIELLRTIYAEEPTPERIKRMIEELFRL